MALVASQGGITRYGGTNAVGGDQGLAGYGQGLAGQLRGELGSPGGRSSGGGGGGGGGGGPPMSFQGYLPKNYANLFELDEPTRRSLALAEKSQAQNFDLARQAQGFNERRFDTVWGGLNGLIGQLGSGGFATAGGQSGQSPEISVGGVFTPQQIQQQVNAARGQNDATTANRVRQAQQQSAGRGFGSNSPMLQALTQRYENQNLATNADTERDIRQNASSLNADQRLATQEARSQQFSERQDEDIRRRQPYFQTANQLIAALAGLA